MFDRECAMCEHLFTCKGKPEGVKNCINFEARDKEKKEK